LGCSQKLKDIPSNLLEKKQKETKRKLSYREQMIHLTPLISLCLKSVAEARAGADCGARNDVYFTVADADGCAVNSGNIVELSEIHRFVTMMKGLLQQTPQKTLVVCAKPFCSHMLANTVLLLGAYMILELKMQFDEVDQAFGPVTHDLDMSSKAFNDTEITVHDCWKSLCYVRKLGWFDFGGDCEQDKSTSGDEQCGLCDLDEYCHYADPANGGLHIIVPGRLLVIPATINLPDGQSWVDVDITRHFSPSFFAELLEAEYNAAIVLRLSHDESSIENDHPAFEDRNIAVESVALGPRGAAQHHMLAAADRLIANLRGSPGPVVVQCCSPRCADGESAGLLLATGLMRVFGFGAGEAAAWLRMACPPLGAATAAC
jgi:hypothetical protein